MSTKKKASFSGKKAQNARISDEVRTERALRSARKLFLENGYEGTSLEMIVSEVGGSYRDLYRKFGDKEALFRRVVGELCAEVVTPLLTSAVPARDNASSTEIALFAIARQFLDAVLSTRALALHRLIVGEAVRFPEMPGAFMKMGPEAAYTAVGAVIRDCLADEGLGVDDPDVVARLYLDMITADLQLRALTGSRISRKEIDNRIERANSIFIAGMRQTTTRHT
jgi:AcrR family transcriptional regulator